MHRKIAIPKKILIKKEDSEPNPLICSLNKVKVLDVYSYVTKVELKMLSTSKILVASAHYGFKRPAVFENAASIWGTHAVGLMPKLEKVQCLAARFVAGDDQNYKSGPGCSKAD